MDESRSGPARRLECAHQRYALEAEDRSDPNS